MFSRNSYVKKFTTKLLECIEDKFEVTVAAGTKNSVAGVGLVLEDTIFFAEGGGQPCDHGEIVIERKDDLPLTLDIKHIIRLKRNDRQVAVHIVEETWEVSWQDLPGSVVHQTLYWPRRKYHMTQHSGQHLLSAVAESMFNFETKSWYLGPDSCYVELGTNDVTRTQLDTLERKVNHYIREALPVTVHVFPKGSAELDSAKTRGLPEDHDGDIRVIEIEGVDRNMCCGTHVSNTRELELIKLLKIEKRTKTDKKAKSKVDKKSKVKEQEATLPKSEKETTCFLHFVVGLDKIFQRFDEMLSREEQISQCINKPPNEHVEEIAEMDAAIKLAHKKIKSLHEEVVMLQINLFKQQSPMPRMFIFYRPDGDLDLMNFITRQFKDMNELVLFLTIGEEDEGHVLLSGQPDLVAEMGPKICTYMVGKGRASGSRFQGKVAHLKGREKIEEMLKEKLALEIC